MELAVEMELKANSEIVHLLLVKAENNVEKLLAPALGEAYWRSPAHEYETPPLHVTN